MNNKLSRNGSSQPPTAPLFVPRVEGRAWRGGSLEEHFFLTILPSGFTSVDYNPDAPDIKEEPPPRTCALWLNSNYSSFEQATQLVQRLRPSIIFHCGDERGDREEWDQLYVSTVEYLRQYHHPGYRYSVSPFVHHLPLGYHREMWFASQRACRPAFERKLLWSWFGSLREDRLPMLDAFRKLAFPSIWGDGRTPAQVAEHYLDSRYVPVGPGMHSLDCYRIYEAAHCGAIPVVVGRSRQEVRHTFCKEGRGETDNLPPWLFADSWPEAVEKILELESDQQQVERHRQRVLLWWHHRIYALIQLLAPWAPRSTR